MSGIFKYCIGEFVGENNASPENVRDKIFTIPNAITLAGIALAILYIIQFSIHLWTWFIPLNIVLIGFSDLFDGYTATHYNQHSWIGKFLDGFRDHLLGGSILLNLTVVSSNLTTYILAALLVFLELRIIYVNCTANRAAMHELRMCSTHTVNKVRRFIHVICGLLFTIQRYWLPNVIVDAEFLLIVMTLGSISVVMWDKSRNDRWSSIMGNVNFIFSGNVKK